MTGHSRIPAPENTPHKPPRAPATLPALRDALMADYARVRSWRRVAATWGVSKGLAYRIAVEGYEPRGVALRARLGLPPLQRGVRLIAVQGVIPDGAQAAEVRKCRKCGAWFITNHPRRRRCFLCKKPAGVNGAEKSIAL